MSTRPRAGAHAACAACLGRSWLLATITGLLDRCARDRERLFALLELDDEQLIDALGGRRSAELLRAYREYIRRAPSDEPASATVCCHCDLFPLALLSAARPARALWVVGEVERLRALTSAPCVAIIGSATASEYGVEVARGLARSLTRSGVVAASVPSGRIGTAAIDGSLAAGAGPLAVAGDGLGVLARGRARSLLERITRAGCVLSELPPGANGRFWGQLLSTRTTVELAQVTVVIEARDSGRELWPAHTAKALGRPVAAVPGRLTSEFSRGTHALLRDGAHLVRGAQDVLELLGRCDARSPRARERSAQPDGPLEPRLAVVLGHVQAGRDRVDDLIGCDGMGLEEAMLALSELELAGLLGRGATGRYAPVFEPFA